MKIQRRTALSVAAMLAVIGVLAALTAIPALAAPPNPPVAFFNETVWLDMYNYGQANAGPVYTSQNLVSGAQYKVTIKGTYSVWNNGTWQTPSPCGTPDNGPMFPSPWPVQTGRVGVDAEWFYAGPYPGQCPSPIPQPMSVMRFSVNNGASWIEVQPSEASMTGNHSYTYYIAGTGSPLGIMRLDSGAGDNYGMLKITIKRQP